MAAEPVWQPNYVDLCDERSIRFGAQCVICDARYATPVESLDNLLVRDAIPADELPKEIENAKRYIFNDFSNAYNGMLVTCYRCQRPACPDCWDDDNQMCGECVAARGLARSPRRGLPSSNPLSDGRLARVEPGRHSDAQRPSWLDALIATQPLDGSVGTPPKQPAVKPRPPEEPPKQPVARSRPPEEQPKRTLLDAALRGASSPGAAAPDMSYPGMPSAGTSFPGMSSPGISSAGMSLPGMSSPGAMDRAAQASYPGGAFAPEPLYESPSPASPFFPQERMPVAPATEQFNPFSSPVSPPPHMASDTWGYSDPGAATTAERAHANQSHGSDGPGMVECPRCGTSNYDFVSRCTNCQLRLIQNCPRCQQLNPGHATHCEFCGEPLNSASGPSQANIPAVPGSGDQSRRRGKQVADAPWRQPKARKAQRAERQDARSASGATAGRGTGEMRAAPQTAVGPFIVQGGALVHYMEAHPFVARLTLWGERLLTAMVVFFVAGLITSITLAELSPTANETLHGVLHIDIRQVLEHFFAQMQILLDRFKHK